MQVTAPVVSCKQLKAETSIEAPKSAVVFEWPFESGFKSETAPIDSHAKMSNYATEINMFTAWNKNSLLSLHS